MPHFRPLLDPVPSPFFSPFLPPLLPSLSLLSSPPSPFLSLLSFSFLLQHNSPAKLAHVQELLGVTESEAKRVLDVSHKLEYPTLSPLRTVLQALCINESMSDTIGFFQALEITLSFLSIFFHPPSLPSSPSLLPFLSLGVWRQH